MLGISHLGPINSVYVVWAALYFCWWGGIMRLGGSGSGDQPFTSHWFIRIFTSLHLLAMVLIEALLLPGILPLDLKSTLEPFLHDIGLTNNDRCVYIWFPISNL